MDKDQSTFPLESLTFVVFVAVLLFDERTLAIGRKEVFSVIVVSIKKTLPFTIFFSMQDLDAALESSEITRKRKDIVNRVDIIFYFVIPHFR